MQDLLDYLNNNFNDPAGPTRSTRCFRARATRLQEDSSVTPFTLDLSHFPASISSTTTTSRSRVCVCAARRAPAGKAQNVRVFFRLWSTQTPGYRLSAVVDLSVQRRRRRATRVRRRSAPGTSPFRSSPRAISASNTDYNVGGVNNRDIEIDAGNDSIWKYYGCFLNVYDASNSIDGKPVQAWLNGTHHCIVAQIAFDDTPIFTGANPEASDKLAQRNLQVTHSDNPGPASTHRIPQTFDIRPSAVVSRNDQVDELMIDWGAIPTGSVASIYWPQVQASDVLMLASMLYPSHSLTATDNHTIACKVTGGVTYVPIPMGSGENFAGLFTVDLPTTVVTGQEFNVVVRRVGRNGKFRQATPTQINPNAMEGRLISNAAATRRADAMAIRHRDVPGEDSRHDFRGHALPGREHAGDHEMAASANAADQPLVSWS